MHEHTDRAKRRKKVHADYCNLFKKAYLEKLRDSTRPLADRKYYAKALRKGVLSKQFTLAELGTCEEELDNLTKE
ncbi:MAG: hypothetical protein A3C50_00555 [Candidatus Staskawiczbacteria bacterium RIFCSPHIGHO2_02_FULL_43_16]|uniref:Uncharacterized protein n=1 Tax=Candidatus Staskawiczbacteria bacterium RIFCSPHIGHO2_01_FULL_41_41 TaxID=1802203 RepID=A0A1G2HSH5_9BACT|nr:MAG: hypothetical protein A2822_04340 [Candidatus Staskawiczbacteria bacterium RIFCSPHIGHO2_01_FULL_41_41]OGZ68253.1 MAG: hypothetical protein A3C50_00555 [Candidatus Staskawiczbacteria bacterium RIFCSPHIGHO2_02_FULL_43_16]OGZ74641.1 MAG: hypothetical protein A3A12_00650 [Candidatus Staskawiczbacteria bacterium RIFCSPLOWO2_01_FULL_43_17b]